uniref:Uncharacterized protein n=1 Tax=Mesocestoides corti TaxID=53468 RepID=A0A5K3FMA1_MESCO
RLVNQSAQPPTQGPPFRCKLPAPRTLNSPLNSTNDYPRLTQHLGLDVSISMTHTSEAYPYLN